MRGGARKGAGRPKGSGIPRKRIWIPLEMWDDIKRQVRDWLELNKKSGK